jgi:hypothetical protein
MLDMPNINIKFISPFPKYYERKHTERITAKVCVPFAIVLVGSKIAKLIGIELVGVSLNTAVRLKVAPAGICGPGCITLRHSGLKKLFASSFSVGCW